jgi:hypothetical protein
MILILLSTQHEHRNIFGHACPCSSAYSKQTPLNRPPVFGVGAWQLWDTGSFFRLRNGVAGYEVQ